MTIARKILKIGVNIIGNKIKKNLVTSCLCSKKSKVTLAFAVKKNSCLYGKNKQI
jgi:hypothetical protein